MLRYLCSADEFLIYPNSVQEVNTDRGVAIPHVFIGKIFNRSSWALKFTSVAGGVIDSDYRSKIKVICHNKSTNFHTILPRQSIAQIVFFRSEIVNFIEVPNFKNKTLSKKDFGSTEEKNE